jgi:hypothetical protein
MNQKPPLCHLTILHYFQYYLNFEPGMAVSAIPAIQEAKVGGLWSEACLGKG